MSRRITVALVGLMAATIIVVGIGTFGLARIANRNQSLKELEQQVQRANNLMPAIGVLLPRIEQRSASQQSSTTPTSTPPTGTNASVARRQLLEALNVTGVGQIIVTADGTPRGQLPDGMRMADLDIERLRSGQVISGVRGSILWAAAAREETTRRGAEALAVTAITKPQERIFGPTAKWFVWSSAVSLLFAAIVALLLGRRLARPVHAAVGATQALARGELGVRLAHPGGRPGDELAVLAQSINTMADQLGRAKDQERQFLLSVSHDLRTPMTSIRGYAEAIRDGAIDDPARGADIILAESQRLERLIGDLLDLARIDSNRFELDISAVNIAEIVTATVEGFRPQLEDVGLALVVHLDPLALGTDGWALVDPDRFAQVVANLTTNAVSFASTTVTALVAIEPAIAHGAKQLVVSIADDGPGIRADAMDRIFERLYQADNQRSRRSGGSGLGLAIVSELVTRMGGTVRARSETGAGATFEVRLPISPAGRRAPLL